MSKKLLHLIDWHFSGIEQNRHDRMAQEMRISGFSIPASRAADFTIDCTVRTE
jgi:hypothetical protein